MSRDRTDMPMAGVLIGLTISIIMWAIIILGLVVML